LIVAATVESPSQPRRCGSRAIGQEQGHRQRTDGDDGGQPDAGDHSAVVASSRQASAATARVQIAVHRELAEMAVRSPERSRRPKVIAASARQAPPPRSGSTAQPLAVTGLRRCDGHPLGALAASSR